jgi:hypothetical protein
MHGDPPTNPREQEDFWPRSGFGNFDLLLLLAAHETNINKKKVKTQKL